MKVFVLYDPGDAENEYGEHKQVKSIKIYKTKEKLYKDLLEEIEGFANEDKIEEINLYYAKGDFEGILEVYEELTDVILEVSEANVIV